MVSSTTRPPLVGIDLVEPQRLQARLERHPDLRASLFTALEQEYCDAQNAPIEHLSARFCAKEAVVKALGLDGWDPLEIEIVGGGEATSVALHGDALRRADDLMLDVSISMSHVQGMAAAIAFALPRSLRPTGE